MSKVIDMPGIGRRNRLESRDRLDVLIYDNIALAGLLSECENFDSDVSDNVTRVAYIIERNMREIQELMRELHSARA